MRQLRLVGLHEDGAHVVVEGPGGDRYRLAVDEKLRAACRGDLSRLGQIEIEAESTLRPRDIQARVRAGESAEQVAAGAGMPIERVLRFAYPVLQERQRVVAQARTTKVRRAGSTPAETLAELVDERLVGRGTEPADVIAERLLTAKTELAAEPEFDVSLVNTSIKDVAHELIALMRPSMH